MSDTRGSGDTTKAGDEVRRRPEDTTAATGGGEEGHMKCTCGKHCGCNPCTCDHSVVSTGVGRAYCKCGPGCGCPTCAS